MSSVPSKVQPSILRYNLMISMSLKKAQKYKIEEEENTEHKLHQSRLQRSHKRWNSRLLSFFIPGLGQIVKGQVGKL